MDIKQVGSIISTAASNEMLIKVPEVVITTTVEKLFDKLFEKMEKRKYIKNLEMGMKEYLNYCYRSNLYVNSFVMGNTKRILLDIYQPLEVCKGNQKNGSEEKYKIVGPKIEFIKRYKNILIVDSAGMGKSTIVKYLSLQMLSSGYIIPIIIELRNLEGCLIEDYIKKQIQPMAKDILLQDVSEMLSQGGFLFFFDGFDEVEDIYKKTIVKEIKRLVNKIPNNYYVITSREEKGLYSFGEFQRFSISDLNISDAFNLIERIDGKTEFSNFIIKEIKDNKNYNNIKELLKTPLLVSLLYHSFDTKACYEVPYKKSDFYNHIFYALYERHDRTKDPTYTHVKRSKLDSSDFNAVLRRFGFKCLENGHVEYDLNTTLDLIGESLDEMKWLQDYGNKEDFLNDILYSVPYFQNYNIRIKWIHKSFMEYFAASFICRDTKDNGYILSLMCSNGYKYYNVLDFCYDLDPKLFRINIVHPMLEELLANRIERPAYICETDFNLRKSILFVYDTRIIKIPKELNYEECINNNESVWLKELVGEHNYTTVNVIWEMRVIFLYKPKDRYESLVHLFKEKKINIFSYKKDYTVYKDFTNIDIDSGTHNINLSSQNILNSESNFITINCLLQDNINNYPYFDFAKCKHMYKEICKEIEEDNGATKYKL